MLHTMSTKRFAKLSIFGPKPNVSAFGALA
jgi:hypothetical protein